MAAPTETALHLARHSEVVLHDGLVGTIDGRRFRSVLDASLDALTNQEDGPETPYDRQMGEPCGSGETTT